MTGKLAEYSSRLDIRNALDEMLSEPSEETDDTVTSLTEKYAKYKMSYVKHLLFQPGAQNLGEFIKINTILNVIFFQ